AGSPEPLVLARDGPVVLELETELTAADLADPALSYAVELYAGPRRLVSQSRTGRDFELRAGKAVVSLLLDPARLAAGTDHEVVLRARKPGDPLDGQPLFRRSLRVRAP
ncbi:MAG TPA: hypothetical protein VJS92_15345, partial [Candidatus Polarisedimenticolaceae bacterium]|nr:hypothetical protein [Candidatus Polarisedimenticolaceae bacterium]